jgi:hypothetical protein
VGRQQNRNCNPIATGAIHPSRLDFLFVIRCHTAPEDSLGLAGESASGRDEIALPPYDTKRHESSSANMDSDYEAVTALDLIPLA